MSEDNSVKTPPHIRIPKSLLDDPLWIDLPPAYKEVFMVILKNVLWKAPQKFDDYGKIIEIQIGQICISEADLLAKCGKFITSNDVQRSILKMKMYGFLSQEVIHRRNVLTIIHPDTYDLLKKASDPRSDPILIQSRSNLDPVLNKEGKKGKKEKSIYSPSAEAAALLIFFNQSIKKFIPEVPEPDESEKAAKPLDDLLKSYSQAEIQKTIAFAHMDDFWSTHVHTTNYLKVKFSKLLAAQRRGSLAPKPFSATQHRFATSEYDDAF